MDRGDDSDAPAQLAVSWSQLSADRKPTASARPLATLAKMPRRSAAALFAAVAAAAGLALAVAQDVELGWDGPYKEDCAFWPEKLVYGFYTEYSQIGEASPEMYFDWLSDKLNVDVEVKEFDSYEGLANAFVADEVDVINLRSSSNTVKIEEEAEARGEPHAVDYSIRFADSKNQTHYYSFGECGGRALREGGAEALTDLPNQSSPASTTRRRRCATSRGRSSASATPTRPPAASSPPRS